AEVTCGAYFVSLYKFLCYFLTVLSNASNPENFRDGFCLRFACLFGNGFDECCLIHKLFRFLCYSDRGLQSTIMWFIRCIYFFNITSPFEKENQDIGKQSNGYYHNYYFKFKRRLF